jgi:transcriptional regulator with XRE-family HTH domain
MSDSPFVNLDLLAKDLKNYIEINNLNQTSFGEIAGISKSNISRILSRIGFPDSEQLAKLAHTMKYPLSRYVNPTNDIVVSDNTDTVNKIKDILYSDPKLSADSQKALFELMEMAYKQFRRLKHV